MRSGHVLGVAIFCGAMGTLGGQTVQAQTPNSQRFVQLLLLNEGTDINAEMKALSTLNNDIAKLDAATSVRRAKQLGKTISRLNHELIAMTARLQLVASQAYNTAVNLTPSNPALVSSALADLLTVQTLSAQAGLGFGPATPSQQ